MQSFICSPNEVKWHLMVASCYRKTGNYQQALQTYKLIHSKFPENVECQYLSLLWENYLSFNLAVLYYRPKVLGSSLHRHGTERNARLRDET